MGVFWASRVSVVRGLIVVPLTRTKARAFVWTHHRHNGAGQPADVLRCGLVVDGDLVGVAYACLPHHQLDDGFTLEIARVCTLGTRNACSKLYGALARAAGALGYLTLYTYTLEEEDGASVKAAGFVFDGWTDPRTDRGGRPRYTENLLGEKTRPEGRKTRWRRDLAQAHARAAG